MGREIDRRSPSEALVSSASVQESVPRYVRGIDGALMNIDKARKSSTKRRNIRALADSIASSPRDDLVGAISHLQDSDSENKAKVIVSLTERGRPERMLYTLAAISVSEAVEIAEGGVIIPNAESVCGIVDLWEACPEVGKCVFEELYEKPARWFVEDQSRKEPQFQIKDALEKSSVQATHIVAGLAMALIDSDKEKRASFKKVWEGVVSAVGENVGTWDLLAYARDNLEGQVSKLADAAHQYMLVMGLSYGDNRVLDLDKHKIHLLGQGKEGRGLGTTAQRHADLQSKFFEFIADRGIVCDCFEVEPWPQEESATGFLSHESLKLRMEFLGREYGELMDESEVSWEIVHLPGGRLSFVFSRGEEGEIEKKRVMRERISHCLQDPGIEDGVERRLSGKELDTLIENVVHIEDEEAQAKLIAQKYPLSLGGPHGLMTSGHRIPFKLPEETGLRGIGMRNMTIRPIDRKEGGGLEVGINWHGWEVQVRLDSHLNILDDGNLSDRSKRWLCSLIYTYVAGIKNPEKGKGVVFTESLGAEDRQLGKGKESAEGKKTGRVAHLILLPAGKRWQKKSKAQLEEADITFGMDLNRLNEEWEAVQRDLMRLKDLEEPYKATIKQQQRKAIERPERARWPRVIDPETGKRVESPMRLTGDVGKIERPLYQLSYMGEVPVVGFMETNIRDVGALIQVRARN